MYKEKQKFLTNVTNYFLNVFESLKDEIFSNETGELKIIDAPYNGLGLKSMIYSKEIQFNKHQENLFYQNWNATLNIQLIDMVEDGENVFRLKINHTLELKRLLSDVKEAALRLFIYNLLDGKGSIESLPNETYNGILIKFNINDIDLIMNELENNKEELIDLLRIINI